MAGLGLIEAAYGWVGGKLDLGWTGRVLKRRTG
ncbi:hypothetical protein QFZ49_001763 [Streptomyces turgidiscabies]|uniref:Transposase n=1 Tax=Streptomyces turgidiscabies TaxID=85558 RepID=A0ABU0RIN8_9ACTN|nr:hypothetical protein [Streptomyces turgidiscabies]